MPVRYRYSRWDGSQDAPAVDGDALLAELADDLMEHGDLRSALRNLLRRGLGGPAPMQGVRDLLRRLRDERQGRLERYDLSSVMDGIRKRLEAVIDLERDALEALGEGRRPEAEGQGEAGPGKEGPGGAAPPAGDAPGAGGDPDFAGSLMRGIADRNLEFLAGLPPDPAGQVTALQDYEFVSPEAQRKFAELLDELREAATRSFFKDVERMVREMSDGDIQRMKDMVRDLNDMLVRKIAGEDPGFEDFMERYGDMFGPNPPGSLEELVDQMQRQMAAVQSLMMSMPTSQFEQLQRLLQDKLGDAGLESQLRSLAQKLDFLDPAKGRRHRFGGDEELDLRAAMRMMEEMHDLDRLESQLRGVLSDGEIDGVDPDKLEEMLGREAREALDQMKRFVEVLEEAGYLTRDGDDYELTPRGMRMIGRRALGEIYRSLRRQGLGRHALPEEGRFGDRLDETKPHEYGESFNLHLSRTLQNALRRQGLRRPIALDPEDFEVYRHERATRTATVMLVDLSWSMELRGAFPAAKKVALALNNLITSAFARDSFHVIGFSAYARELKSHEVPFLTTDEHVFGTNMQHALLLAEQLLSRQRGGTRQVLMITDGEPTAHIENGRAQFAYPPSPTTIRETLRAVKRCTRKGITINTFMLDTSHYLRMFMDEVSRINGGRVFYSSPERLGEYVLVDYVRNRRQVLGRR